MHKQGSKDITDIVCKEGFENGRYDVQVGLKKLQVACLDNSWKIDNVRFKKSFKNYA